MDMCGKQVGGQQLALVPRPRVAVTYDPFGGPACGMYRAESLHPPYVVGWGFDEEEALRELADELRRCVCDARPPAGLTRAEQLLTAAARLDEAGLVEYLRECSLPATLSPDYGLVLR